MTVSLSYTVTKTFSTLSMKIISVDFNSSMKDDDSLLFAKTVSLNVVQIDVPMSV